MCRFWITIALSVIAITPATSFIAPAAFAQTPTPGVPQQPPAGTTEAGFATVNVAPNSAQNMPATQEPVSVTSSDPSVATADATYSNLTGSWSIDFQGKKPGVAVVTITWKDGTKGAVLVGCGVAFPLQTVNYTKGMYNAHSYLGWTDANGTLTIKGVYEPKDDKKTQPFEITVSGYAKPASSAGGTSGAGSGATGGGMGGSGAGTGTTGGTSGAGGSGSGGTTGGTGGGSGTSGAGSGSSGGPHPGGAGGTSGGTSRPPAENGDH